jgi:hypothetical protein
MVAAMIGMKKLMRSGLAVLLPAVFIVRSACAESIAPVKLDDLFKEANLVAVVHILSGDAEHYPAAAVYEGEILTAFKGAKTGERVYIGPFVGLRVGYDYLAFLSRSTQQILPENDSPSFYGEIASSYRIMYSGHGILDVEYVCVFDGAKISQQCDYGIKLNPDQVVLPSNVNTFPSGEAGAITNYKKWVRRNTLISLLEQFSDSNRTLPSK